MLLSEWQVMLVGFIAVVLAEIFKFYRDKAGKPVSTTAIQWITFVLSFPLALWWGGVNLPVLPIVVGDPAVIVANILEYAGAWVMLFGLFIGNATVIYHLLKKLVFEKLG